MPINLDPISPPVVASGPDTVYTRPSVSQAPTLWTYRDLIDRLIDYSNSGAIQTQVRDYRIAIDEAYRELCYCHIWKYLSGVYNLALVPPYNDGTVVYTQSTRTVTLSGGTFPTWAVYAHIRIGNTFYDVEQRTSGTTLILSLANNPGVDIASTTYQIYRSSYTLPADFRGMHKGNVPNSLWASTYIEPAEWFRLERRTAATGNPRCWTIMADPRLYGSFAVFLWPYSSTANTYAFIYARKTREMRVSGYAAATDSVGTVSISAAGQTVTGVSTNFTPQLVGTIIRFGDATYVPDGFTGLHPYNEQKIVMAVNSTTELLVDSPVTNAYSAVKYCCSDVVDLPPEMLNALLAGIKWKYEFNRPAEPKLIQLCEANYRQAVLEACDNDSIVLSGRYEEPVHWDRMHTHMYGETG